MTPADEARFIAPWQAGTETAVIAQALGIPPGTVSSRAHVLQLQGKIQARPRGGSHARRVAQARQAEAGVSADISRVSERVSADTPGVPRDTPQVSAGVSTRTPLPAERGKSIRWNLHFSEGLRERIKAQAKARGLQDSQMVEELLWLALSIVEGNSDGPD